MVVGKRDTSPRGSVAAWMVAALLASLCLAGCERKPPEADVAPPKLDAQGRSRIYLEESKPAAAANKIPAVPMFAAAMSVEGKVCGG